MAEKKIHKRMMDRLTRWVAWEQKASSYLVKKQSDVDIPEEVTDITRLWLEEKFLTRPRLLAELYMTHLDFVKNTPEEERKSLEGWLEKYLLYAQNLENFKGKTTKLANKEALMRSETLNVMALRHTTEDQRYTDYYNVKMLMEDSGEDILFCAPWKTWLVWDGKRWKKDEAFEIYELAKDAINGMYLKSMDLKDEEERLILMEHASRNKTIRKVEALVRGASWNRKVRIYPEDLDRDKYLFNCHNGTIDLTCGRIRPPNRIHKITNLSPIEYKPEMACPHWLKFLTEIFENRKATIEFVQKAVGLSLTGDVSAQAMFILHGTGANGKSTFINIIMKVMGDYAASTPTETFMQKKGDTANNDIARLKGKRFVSAMEAERGMKLAEAVIKRLTGNDSISARFLYGEFFEFTPTFKIFMATNHKPKIGGMDNAIWRRIKLIPFNAVFTKDQQDPHLQEKLETELPGILAWMVEGCLKWQKEGLGEPPEVKHATDEYRHEMSAVEAFLEECCHRDENSMIQSSKLYEAYKTWCEKNNERLLSMRAFSMRLSETGLDKVRLSPGWHWLGVSLQE